MNTIAASRSSSSNNKKSCLQVRPLTKFANKMRVGSKVTQLGIEQERFKKMHQDKQPTDDDTATLSEDEVVSDPDDTSCHRSGNDNITMREAWDLPDESTWPHGPVLLCINSPVCSSLSVPKYGTGPCPIGVPFEFSSDLFEGTCLIRLRDGPVSDNVESDDQYFAGRRRKFQSIVQGRFKKPMPVSDVLTGHEFVRPLQKLPPSWMVRTGTNLIRRIAPGVEIVLHQEQPRALAILAATSQTISADAPGNEPNIASESDIAENASLLGGIFDKEKKTVSPSSRKRHLSDPKCAEEYMYDTETIYTFDFYQQLLDVGSYSLDLGFTKLGLCKTLDGQPIQVMSKTRSGEYLWSFQLWHKDLLKSQNASSKQ